MCGSDASFQEESISGSARESGRTPLLTEGNLTGTRMDLPAAYSGDSPATPAYASLADPKSRGGHDMRQILFGGWTVRDETRQSTRRETKGVIENVFVACYRLVRPSVNLKGFTIAAEVIAA
jgi:hypothetical protein